MRNDIRNLLITQRREFLSSLQAAQNVCSQAQQPGFTIRTHPADREDNPEIFSVNVVRVAHLKDCLTQVDQAIERLKDGNFGYCGECGKKIPLKRLKVMPFAHLCVDCQGETEKK